MGKRNRHRKRNKGGSKYGAAHHQKGGAVSAQTGSLLGNYNRDCHHGPVAVFTIGKSIVWAGSKDEIRGSYKNWALYISLLGPTVLPDPALTMSPVARALGLVEDVPEKTPWIAFDWSDGEAPNRVPYATWRQLAKSLKDGKVEGNIAVFCQGGHGRTGTALALLAHYCGVMPEGVDPVEWARLHYCLEAVETLRQIDYIEAATGRTVMEEPSWGSLPATYYEWKYGAGGPAAQQYDPGPYTTGSSSSTSTTKTLPGFSPASEARKVALGPTTAQSAGGKEGRPITNAAGDIIAYEYDREEGDAE